MSDLELLQAIRLDIIGELGAINQYDQHASQTTNPKAKKIWQDIANDERTHVGMLFTLLFELDPLSAEMFLKGQQQAKDLIRSMQFKR